MPETLAADTPPPVVLRPTLKFLLAHPAHFIALGAGSGLSRAAPGTVGTLWAWAGVRAPATAHDRPALGRADRGLDPGGLVGLHRHRAPHARGRLRPHRLGRGGGFLAGALAGDTRGFWGQFAAFALFRLFDAVKIGPMAWADRTFKGFGPRGGFGILLDDFAAALCTLLVIALWRY
jgi:phosphatidylglycerophosphatase A